MTPRRHLHLVNAINREDAAVRREHLLTHGPTEAEYMARLSDEERWMMRAIGETVLEVRRHTQGKAA